MYILQEKPIPYRLKGDGDHELLTPNATLISDFGQVYHIDQDDSCYVLVSIDTDSQLGKWVTHWFPEAVDALKTLPTPVPPG